jgi:hypothetical protein
MESLFDEMDELLDEFIAVTPSPQPSSSLATQSLPTSTPQQHISTKSINPSIQQKHAVKKM